MLRRELYALPEADQLPGLIAVLEGGSVEPADGPAFLGAAVSHRVVGACTEAMDRGRLALPPREGAALRDAHAVGTLRAALMRRELAVVSEPLAEACGAAPVVLKGPAIADRFYDPPSLRTFADLDMLVSKDRLGDAVRALEGLGYAERVELRPGFGARHGHDVHMAKPVGRHRADVELHWRVGDDPLGEALSHDALASAAVPADGPANARYPSAPDQLLVCSMHLLSDRLKRLCWVEDVRRVSESMDDGAWEVAFGRARDLRLLWVLNRALDYAGHHLGYGRPRPRPLGPGEPPRWGPLRAVEELDFRASVHVGRLVAMPWRDRPSYLRDVLVPSREGLEGTVGGDDAGGLRLAARHLGRALRGLRGRR